MRLYSTYSESGVHALKHQIATCIQYLDYLELVFLKNKKYVRVTVTGFCKSGHICKYTYAHT